MEGFTGAVCSWARVWPVNFVQRPGLCPQEPTLRPGARAPSLQPARALLARASTLKRSSPPRPGGRGHRRAPTLALSASSWGPPPSLGTHHSESEPPNAASTSPSSRHLSRFLVAEMHSPAARQAGKASSRCRAAWANIGGLRTTNTTMHRARAGPGPRGLLGNVVLQTSESAGVRVTFGFASNQGFSRRAVFLGMRWSSQKVAYDDGI